MKTIFLRTLVTCSLLSFPAMAEDTSQIMIFKEAGESPRVDAAGVDLLGAEKVYELLGEDFVVFNKSNEQAQIGVAAATVPKRPVRTPPGTIPPVLPICQCPEDYVATLEQRLTTMNVEEFLAPKRFVLTQDHFQALETGQFPQLEQLMQNNPQILMGQ